MTRNRILPPNFHEKHDMATYFLALHKYMGEYILRPLASLGWRAGVLQPPTAVVARNRFRQFDIFANHQHLEQFAHFGRR